jgi:cytochrome P450
MTDGPTHSTMKPIVSAALSAADTELAAEIAGRRAAAVLNQGGATRFTRLLFEVPAAVVGELCGLLPTVDVSDATRSFVACIPASATREDQVGASTAAVSLSALLSPLLSTDSHGVLDELVRAAREAEVHDTGALLANAVGLLSQTYDATAGLVGNTLLAWRRDQAQQAGHVEVTTEYVLEVARHDAPIQNTRRFASADVRMLGETVRAGQAVLVVLAAANRDPAANVDPDAFLPGRRAAALFTFGLGAHACPGRQLAVVIATAVVRTALEHGVDESSLPGAVRYRPLANARIPEL